MDQSASPGKRRDAMRIFVIVVLTVMALIAIVITFAVTVGGEDQEPHDMENMMGVLLRA